MGRLSVRGKVIDQDGDTASYSAPVYVQTRPQTLSFTSTPPNPAYVNSKYTPVAKSTSGLAVTLKAGPPNVCLLNGGVVTFIAPGSCTVTGDQAGDATYHVAQQIRQTIGVIRLPQTITFGSTPSSTTLGTAVTLSATGGASGQPVVFSSLTPNVCTVSGTTAQMTAIGSCVVAANQAGRSLTYDPAPQVTRTIAVVWAFAGFYAPVQNAPVVNTATAGHLVEIPFSLGGNQGTNVLAVNSPSSQAVACDANATSTKVGAAKRATAGLTYDAASARYTFTWATDRAWTDTCRTFTLTLADGTTHTLRFTFK